MNKQLMFAGVMLLWLVGPVEAVAQDAATEPGDTFASSVTLAEVQRSPSLDLTRLTTPNSPLEIANPPESQTSGSSGRRTPARAILGAIVGGTAGFFGGAYTGAYIEDRRCDCELGALKGAVIGGSVGAVLGGILGGFYLF
jgi:hypothetical protein